MRAMKVHGMRHFSSRSASGGVSPKLDGSQRGKSMAGAILWPSSITATFGPPVDFDRSSTSKDALEAAMARIRAAIEALSRPTPP